MPDPKNFQFGDRRFSSLEEMSGYYGAPYSVFFEITPGTSYNFLPRAIIADVDGSMTFVDAAGNTIADFPLFAGENRICPVSISSIETTSKIWGAM